MAVRVRLVPLFSTHDVAAASLLPRQGGRVRLPLGALGDRLTVGRQPLKLLMEVRVLLPELLAQARRGWSLQTPRKRLVLHELARLVTPVVKRTITRASEARGLGSTPGWGNVTYGVAAASRGVAGWMSPARRGGLLVPPTCPRATAGCGVSPPAGLCYPRGVPASTRPCEGRGPGSIPGGDTARGARGEGGGVRGRRSRPSPLAPRPSPLAPRPSPLVQRVHP